MKIVIWGLKLHSHTHSYIHYGYWRAAEALGHEVHWYDDEDDVSSVDFSDSVFITEHRVCENMPLRTDCKYFIHCNINDSVNKTDNSIFPDQFQRIQKVILNGFSRWVKIRLDC